MNARSPMAVMPAGKVTLVSDVQELNVSLWISVMSAWMLALARDVQLRKALSPR